MAADIQTTAREIDFVTRFGRNWDHLRDIMGVTRKIEMLPNTVLKSKYAQGTLQDGKVGEGEKSPTASTPSRPRTMRRSPLKSGPRVRPLKPSSKTVTRTLFR